MIKEGGIYYMEKNTPTDSWTKQRFLNNQSEMNFPTHKSANREKFSLFVVNLNKNNSFNHKNIV